MKEEELVFLIGSSPGGRLIEKHLTFVIHHSLFIIRYSLFDSAIGTNFSGILRLEGSVVVSEAEVQILDAVDPQGCGLRVEFFRVGPRWAHRLLAVEEQALRPLLESVEGDQQQFFPPSPALQQLAFQQQDDGVNVAPVDRHGRQEPLVGRSRGVSQSASRSLRRGLPESALQRRPTG